MSLRINDSIEIDERELVESFVRSSGPGGQNVNKLSTAVELRFDIRQSASLPEWVRVKLLARRDRRITQDGVMVINGQRFRTQDKNRSDVRERLAEVLRAALVVEKPRVATSPSRNQKRKRVDHKVAVGLKKKLRSKPSSAD